jgi:hypothetical protein
MDTRNRASTSDRPRDSDSCREVPLVDRPQPGRCHKERGHAHVFRRGDRYGCCAKCGDEVLT